MTRNDTKMKYRKAGAVLIHIHLLTYFFFSTFLYNCTIVQLYNCEETTNRFKFIVHNFKQTNIRRVFFLSTCKSLAKHLHQFYQIGPLGRFGLDVVMSIRLCVSEYLFPFSCYFLRGLSLALKSHDQFEASHCTMRKKMNLIFNF